MYAIRSYYAQTTQIMALTPQPTDPAEKALAERLTSDPEDYRVTVWPTIAGPTGEVPAPPKSSLTRNFGMMGKDAVVGPSFMGQSYTSFLLSLMHRPWPRITSYNVCYTKLLRINVGPMTASLPSMAKLRVTASVGGVGTSPVGPAMVGQTVTR